MFPFPEQMQCQPTPVIFQKVAGNGLPTPVLTFKVDTYFLDWSTTPTPAHTNQWNIWASATPNLADFSEFDVTSAATKTYDLNGAGYDGFYFLVFATNLGHGVISNNSNIVQSTPLLQSVGDVDSPELFWEFDNPNLPNFWSVYQYNGSGDTNNPANYSFLDSVTGDNVIYPVDSGSLQLNQWYLIRGTVTPGGTASTVYSNPAFTLA